MLDKLHNLGLAFVILSSVEILQARLEIFMILVIRLLNTLEICCVASGGYDYVTYSYANLPLIFVLLVMIILILLTQILEKLTLNLTSAN